MKLGQKEGRKLAVELAKKYPREVLEEVGAILCCNPLGGTKVKASQLIAAGQKMGVKEVVEWIKRNAIYSHEPSCEHILIKRHEMNFLEEGELPPEREKIVFKNGG